MDRILYTASSNPGTPGDFRLAAAQHDIEVAHSPRLEAIAAPPEDAPTFEENALEKAIYYSQFLPGEMVLADDSGLAVDALGGAPGIRSARYAADAGFREATATDANNNLFLLQQLGGITESDRGARYHCALAVAEDSNCVLASQGTVEGRILSKPRGNGGFGYDPLFYVPRLERTMAELDDQTRWIF